MTDAQLPEIAVLLGETGRDYDIANDLMRTGFNVYVCANAQEVHALVRVGKAPVLLVDASQAAAFESYTLTRLVYTRGAPEAAAAPAAGTHPDVHVRGADSGSGHLAAILRTMQRHLAAPRPARPDLHAGSPAQWRLSTPPRRLISPDGHGVPLTLTEWQFVSHLFMVPNHTLTFAQWQAASARDGMRHLHNVAVLVSRLRRKALRQGIDLPLEAVRGVGYAFTESCARFEPVMESPA